MLPILGKELPRAPQGKNHTAPWWSAENENKEEEGRKSWLPPPTLPPIPSSYWVRVYAKGRESVNRVQIRGNIQISDKHEGHQLTHSIQYTNTDWLLHRQPHSLIAERLTDCTQKVQKQRAHLESTRCANMGRDLSFLSRPCKPIGRQKKQDTSPGAPLSRASKLHMSLSWSIFHYKDAYSLLLCKSISFYGWLVWFSLCNTETKYVRGSENTRRQTRELSIKKAKAFHRRLQTDECTEGIQRPSLLSLLVSVTGVTFPSLQSSQKREYIHFNLEIFA